MKINYQGMYNSYHNSCVKYLFRQQPLLKRFGNLEEIDYVNLTGYQRWLS